MEEAKKLGMKLKACRKNCGMTQKELSKRLGVNNSAVSKYEGGSVYPPSDKLMQMAEILGVPLEALVDDTYALAEEVEENGHEVLDDNKEPSETQKKMPQKATAGARNKSAEDGNFNGELEECTVKSEESSKSAFSETAAFCEHFDPGKFLKRKMASFRGMILDGCICTGKTGPLYVPAMYLPIEAYRAWLRAVYPEYSITEKPFRVDTVNEEQFVTAEVVIFRKPGDPSPFSAIGLSKVTRSRSFANIVKFARADAIKRAMVNQGFGDGLDWDSLQENLPAFTGTDFDEENIPHAFVEYFGEIYCNGKVIREAKKASLSEPGKNPAAPKRTGTFAGRLDSDGIEEPFVNILPMAPQQQMNAAAASKTNHATEPENRHENDENEMYVKHSTILEAILNHNNNVSDLHPDEEAYTYDEVF